MLEINGQRLSLEVHSDTAKELEQFNMNDE